MQYSLENLWDTIITVRMGNDKGADLNRIIGGKKLKYEVQVYDLCTA